MRKIFVLFAVPLLVASWAAAKSKNNFPQLIVSAKYVHVTTYYGSEPGNFRIPPEDLRAVADVEQALRKWGRYSITMRPRDADLIMVVRRGRLAAVTAGGRVGIDSSGRVGRGPVAGAEAGSPDDSLEVYDAHLGTDSSPLWRRTAADGLHAPELPLIQEFRKQVEAAAAQKP